MMQNTIVFVLGLLTVVSATPEKLNLQNINNELVCNKFFVSGEEAVDQVVKLTNIESLEDCQLYCSFVYDENCQFFTYYQSSNLCFIYNIDMNDYIEASTYSGGPKESTRQECADSNNPCSAFLHESCTLEGVIGKPLTNVKDEASCKQRCKLDKDCKLYKYNRSGVHVTECTLYSSDNLKCKGLIGDKTAGKFEPQCA